MKPKPLRSRSSYRISAGAARWASKRGDLTRDRGLKPARRADAKSRVHPCGSESVASAQRTVILNAETSTVRDAARSSQRLGQPSRDPRPEEIHATPDIARRRIVERGRNCGPRCGPHRLPARYPPHSGRQLLQVPRTRTPKLARGSCDSTSANTPWPADAPAKPALVPGKPGDSELIRRITSGDADHVMPPPKSGKKLTPAQIDLLRRWIAAGARYQQHWAFVPPVRPAVPKVQTRQPGAQSHRRLHPGSPGTGGPEAGARGEQGDAAAPPAPRPDRPAADARGDRRLPRRHRRRRLRESRSIACWRRRTTANAGAGTGSTPPATPTATASRRTSRARSGSTATGSSMPSTATCPTTSSSSSSSPATCCPNATQDQRVATGFLRNSMINEEGGIDPEQFRMEAMFDRMDAVGKGVLGLTIQCAQCHNHKFDPADAGRILPDVRLPQQHPRGQHRRLHAGGADEAGRDPAARSATSRPAAAPHRLTGPSEWRRGRRRRQQRSARVARRAR